MSHDQRRGLLGNRSAAIALTLESQLLLALTNPVVLNPDVDLLFELIQENGRNSGDRRQKKRPHPQRPRCAGLGEGIDSLRMSWWMVDR